MYCADTREEWMIDNQVHEYALDEYIHNAYVCDDIYREGHVYQKTKCLPSRKRRNGKQQFMQDCDKKRKKRERFIVKFNYDAFL